jgi:D-aminopeptidase
MLRRVRLVLPGCHWYEYKGSSGTASRLLDFGGVTYTVGVFLQANFGARAELTIAGVPLGRRWPKTTP